MYKGCEYFKLKEEVPYFHIRVLSIKSRTEFHNVLSFEA